MLTVSVTEAIRLHQKAKAAVDALGPRDFRRGVRASMR